MAGQSKRPVLHLPLAEKERLAALRPARSKPVRTKSSVPTASGATTPA